MKNRPVKTIIVGGGHRSLTYAQLAKIESDKMEIVGVADPDENSSCHWGRFGDCPRR